MNFLGRPEPIFSYQNTTRSLSLSFTLLVDTVAKHQDIATTIQRHYDYLYGCAEFPDTNPTPPPPPPPSPTPTPRPAPTAITSEEIINLGTKYCFKNDRYFVKITDVDYTSGDTGSDYDANGIEITVSNLNTKRNNELFISNLNKGLTNFSSKITKDTNEITIIILGTASELFSSTNKKREQKYNLGLGMRRAYSLMKTIISEFNANYGTSELGTIDANTQEPKLKDESNGLYYFGEYETNANEPITKIFTFDNNKKSCKINFELRTEGSAKASDNPSFIKRNDGKYINERSANAGNAIIKSTTASQSTAPAPISQPTTQQSQQSTQASNIPEPCDPSLTLDFQKITNSTRFPLGPERLKTFTPSFNSQTPFDFTKRYVFLHQLTRPSKLKNLTNIENTAFGRMPVFVLRYGDFIHSKAIAKSINFDLQESTWDLNPEGMGAIPLICNVTMDIMLLGGQSLAGPIDKIQTANDSAFIANTSFNSGRYKDNNRFKSVRDIEEEIYGNSVAGGSSSNNQTTSNANTNLAGGGGNAAGGTPPPPPPPPPTTPPTSPVNNPPVGERDTNIPKKDKDKNKTQQKTNKNKSDKARKSEKDNSKEKNNSEIKTNLNKSAIPGLTTQEIQRVASLPAPSFNFNPNTSLQGDNTNIYRKAGAINKPRFGGFGGGRFGGGGATGNF
jgi:hypothetical protein